jgi:ubiquinone/menaquinone biosynthesis C-methylase UbiE
MTDPYYESRYKWDKNRTIVWREIVRYLDKYIPAGTVLDIGAGYCDFINNISAKEKIALDYSPELSKYASKDVKTVQSRVTDMSQVEGGSVDLVFASNLLEHLTDEDLEKTISEIKRVLKKEGRIILMQPNYRLNPKHYFDDPTHKKIFTDESMKSFLLSNGFNIELSKSRFLPLSMNSKPSAIPIFPLLIRAYIYSPIKPFAGQMLFVANL